MSIEEKIEPILVLKKDECIPTCSASKEMSAMDTKIEQRAPDAPLYMPPFADFVAWLRANPDYVFEAIKADQKLGTCCPIGVFARMYNAGDTVQMGLCEIERGDPRVDQIEMLHLPNEWRFARIAADDATHCMRYSITAADLLIRLTHKAVL